MAITIKGTVQLTLNSTPAENNVALKNNILNPAIKNNVVPSYI